MYRQVIWVLATLFLATAAQAQAGLTIPATVKPEVREQAEKIYAAACSTVQREFGSTHSLSPKVVLVLGAQKDGVRWEEGEILLRKWDPYMFAQGVVVLAYRDLMPLQVRATMARRAVSWAGATVNVRQLER